MIRVRHALLRTAAAVALLPLAAACSDEPEPPPRPPTSASPSPSSEPPEPSPTTALTHSPSPTASAPADPAKAEKQVRAAWARFFASGASVKERADVAEDGDQYQLMIEALRTDPEARLLRARVDSVTFTSDLHARVRYTLFANGHRIGPEAPGASVRQDGTWKVSTETVCSLTRYGEDVPRAPVC
ncbi:hypothetical protein [Streptomyces ochraceiscleroticus]|uniref:Low molecular weight antigen MTB12-like C-terminal domain-containing protein n=1 Tax=Streptomyces ochraceiscleroticus TaxID=47761 RepID=A0ABW1MMD6_9ACTN|nr:hypothetical protein [Streptomyces ochraceiscleroticus]